jgi:uncharacterized protein YjbJ (UPF0337 family)
MNRDTMQGQWHQVKGEAKVQWGKLTDDDIDQINGNAEKLIGKVQERYGYARDRAEQEVNRFRSKWDTTDPDWDKGQPKSKSDPTR